MDGSVNENSSLIAADKVQGTEVYNRSGENIGSIYDLMLDKRSGNVAYAIMSFGGFLGLGNNYHPLPWSMLKYDANMGGYVIDIENPQLEKAPAYAASETPAWGDEAYETGIHRYYGVPPYWGGAL